MNDKENKLRPTGCDEITKAKHSNIANQASPGGNLGTSMNPVDIVKAINELKAELLAV